MRSTAKYNSAINLLCLAIIVIAYSGKTLHRHSDEYYADFERSECTASGRSSIADDCQICHFSFYSCLYAETPIFIFATALLVRHIRIPVSKRTEESHFYRSLRAPPTESPAIM